MTPRHPRISGIVPSRSGWVTPLRVALIYALVSGLWIVLSDRVLLWFFDGAEELTRFQTLKGWFFVAATAALLAWLVRRDMKYLQAEVDNCQSIQESFRVLVETVPNGIQECDTRGTITFTSAGYDRIYGLRPGAAIGTMIWDKTEQEASRRELQEYLAMLVERQPPPTPFITRNRTGDGRIIDVQVDWDYLRDPQGNLTGFASVITDITERRRAEEAIRTSDRLKSELITTAAHEFRTPLTTVQGFSELLLDNQEFSPEERQEYLQIIHDKSVALSSLVESLLDISRIEAGRPIPMHLAPCPVADLLRQVAPLLKSLGSRHRFEFEVVAEETLVQADRGKISQVLENLLGNAFKYSAPGSLVRLRGEPVGESYRLQVVDQGIGMSAEQVTRVFEHFYRVDNSDTSPGGLGIGMTIVRDIVEAHGGKVRLESALGQGTTVSFELPILPQQS